MGSIMDFDEFQKGRYDLDKQIAEEQKEQKELKELKEQNNSKIIKRTSITGYEYYEHINEDNLTYLREIAENYNPIMGDKLYPLEVLGVYHLVQFNHGKWSSMFHGNPETFIDDLILDWMKTCDINKFKNRLERCLYKNDKVKNLFLIRMNYAYLLEEGKDSISIHRGKHKKLEWYKAVDDLEVTHGNHNSSIDLIKNKEELERLAENFYDNIEEIKSTKTGTNNRIRQAIFAMLSNYGYDIDYDLDAVYKELNKLNRDNLEEGLIARIAYLAFEAEFKDKVIKYIKIISLYNLILFIILYMFLII